MNLIQNEQKDEKEKQAKKIMKLIIALIILLVIISIGLVCAIYYMQNSLVKLSVDGKEIAKFADDLFIKEDDTIYVSIRDYSKLVGYTVYSGDHSSENTDKGYIQNTYEEASFEVNSNKLYKTLLQGGNTEYFNLEKPVKMINNKLYMSVEGMQIATTSVISYNAKNNQYTVYTLPTLVASYTRGLKDVNISPDFNNQKAVLYSMIVVQNIQGKYGVLSLDGTEIIGTKYVSIEFVESSKDFIVKTDSNKMGILSSNGSTKIAANYDGIKQIDKDLNLYLVKNNNKYGVINQNGSTILHIEYDDIGVDTTLYSNNSVRKQYLLFGDCIAIQRDRKWGMYNTSGKTIMNIEYENFGCTVGAAGMTTNPVLLLDEYEAIVVGKNKKYGLIDKTGNQLIPCVLDSIYSVTEKGTKTYYMVQGEKTLNLIEYIEKYVLKNETNTQENTTNTNTENPNNNTDINENDPSVSIPTENVVETENTIVNTPNTSMVESTNETTQPNVPVSAEPAQLNTIVILDNP